MISNHRCVVKEFPIPDREYRVAPAEHWDVRSAEQAASSRRVKRRRRSRLPPVLFSLGLLLGLLLGRTALAREFPLQLSASPVSSLAADGKRTDGVMPELPVEAGNGSSSGWFQEAEETADWNLLLVNREHPLPEDFAIPKLTQLANGHTIDSRAYLDLQRMMDDARAAGFRPTICSSFRTEEKQAQLFENKVQSLLAEGYDRTAAEEQAAMWVARPGTSEHQAGLAVDIVDKSYQLLDAGQEETAVQQWLMEHCDEYGFILRYPTDKSQLTGVNYEPWHYRYVGTEAAAEIMERGICLEEYLAERS